MEDTTSGVGSGVGSGVRSGIVVGVDTSAASAAGLEWALAEAVRRRAPLTAVRAWLDPVTAGYPVAVVVADAPDDVQAAAQDGAQEALRAATARVPGADALETRALAVRGPAAAVLADASRTADLLVIGTRSHGALSRAVLGSVSASVLHHAHSPVAVVPEPAEPTTAPARVVVGVDHSKPSLAALAWGAGYARRTGQQLVPVLVREPVWTADPVPTARLGELENSERQALRDLVLRDPYDVAQASPYADLDIAPEVLSGHAAGALLDLVQPQDTLVVGSRGRGGFANLLLGSTSTFCAQHARCPVVVVRHGASG